MQTNAIAQGFDRGVKIGAAMSTGEELLLTLVVFLAFAVAGLYVLRAVFRYVKR